MSPKISVWNTKAVFYVWMKNSLVRPSHVIGAITYFTQSLVLSQISLEKPTTNQQKKKNSKPTKPTKNVIKNKAIL